MAFNRKAQKESDQSTRRLMDYVCETAPWDSFFDELIVRFIEPAANKLERDFEHVRDELFDGPGHSIAWGFIFEEMVSVDWNNEGNAIAAYLKQRGWRESSYGKSYLRALAKSSVKLWEITDVSPGQWIDLRLHGTTNKPKKAYENNASQYAEPGECLAARVLLAGKQRVLSDASLLLSEDIVHRIQARVQKIPGEIEALYQEIEREENLKLSDLPDDPSEEIQHAQEELLAKLAFSLWVATTLLPKKYETT